MHDEYLALQRWFLLESLQAFSMFVRSSFSCGILARASTSLFGDHFHMCALESSTCFSTHPIIFHTQRSLSFNRDTSVYYDTDCWRIMRRLVNVDDRGWKVAKLVHIVKLLDIPNWRN